MDGEDYCFANTFIKIDSSFYRENILPFNIISVLLSAVVFPGLLIVIIVYGIKKN